MSLPYFRFYPTDYEADTTHLTTEEDGAYFRLLRLCWRTPGCSLPNDHEWIRRRVRATEEEYERAYEPVLEEFFRVENRRVMNPRLHREYEESAAKHQAAKTNGQKGGRPTKALKNNKSEKADGSEIKTQKKANQNQNQNHKEEASASSCAHGAREAEKRPNPPSGGSAKPASRPPGAASKSPPPKQARSMPPEPPPPELSLVAQDGKPIPDLPELIVQDWNAACAFLKRQFPGKPTPIAAKPTPSVKAAIVALLPYLPEREAWQAAFRCLAHDGFWRGTTRRVKPTTLSSIINEIDGRDPAILEIMELDNAPRDAIEAAQVAGEIDEREAEIQRAYEQARRRNAGAGQPAPCH